MADETFNQRPAVIGAVIFAALTALGLWYFLVFRPADSVLTPTETPLSEITTATPTPDVVNTNATAERVTPAQEGVVRAPGQSTTTPPPQIKPTAGTGPAEMVALVSGIAMSGGLLGLLFVTRRPTLRA